MSTAARRDEVQGDRLARARAALSAAERSASRWGGRIDRTALRATSATPAQEDPQPSPRELSGPTGLVPPPGRDDGGSDAAPRRSATPRSIPDGDPEADPSAGQSRLPVPTALAALIPSGTLRAGSSVAVTGDADCSLLLSLAIAAMGEDTWCAVAGMPDLGIGGLLDAGADPDRLALVPGSSAAEVPQLPQVLSALVDGVGVLVLGPDLEITPALWRTLTSRARTRDTLVLAASPPERADLRLEASGMRWLGLGGGSGRLRGRRVHVTSWGRGISGRREGEVLLPDVRGLLSEAPSAARSAAPAGTRILHPMREAL